jgi:hypothetical protein
VLVEGREGEGERGERARGREGERVRGREGERARGREGRGAGEYCGFFDQTQYIPTQKCVHTFHHHNAPIFKLAYDGLRFITCGLDNTFVVGEFYQNCKLVKLGSILD